MISKDFRLRLDANKKGVLATGEVFETFKRVLKTRFLFKNWAIGEVKVVPHWSFFQNRQILVATSLLKKTYFVQIVLKLFPF